MKIIDVAKSHKLASTLIAVMVGVLGVSFYLPSETVEPVEKPKTVEIKKDQEPKVEEMPTIEAADEVEAASAPVSPKVEAPAPVEVVTVEQPIVSDEEFYSLFFQEITDKHKRSITVTNIGMYNAIYNAYKNNPSQFLPSKTSEIIDNCLDQLEELRKTDPDIPFALCKL